MKNFCTQEMSSTALLGVCILLSGSFKIPSPVLGGEFQLSAPVAVLICACSGFRRYLLAGILASVLGLLLGLHNIYGVIIQLAFRIAAGGVLTFLGVNTATLIVSGAFGTLFARLLLSWLTGVSWIVLSAAALPGMLFTAAAVCLCYKPALKLLRRLSIQPH